MTLTVTIVVAALAGTVIVLTTLLAVGWWRRREQTGMVRARLLEQEANRRGQLVVALALMLQGKGRELRIPKATLEEAVSFSITPMRRPDGGVDLPLVSLRAPAVARKPKVPVKKPAVREGV